MPPIDKHNSQYVSNKGHLNSLLALPSPPYDWVITVSFYCAVHLVEKELAKHNKHPENHRDRYNEMNNRMTFDSIAKVYQALYNESRTSRYKCRNMNHSKAQEAIKNLGKIEVEFA